MFKKKSNNIQVQTSLILAVLFVNILFACKPTIKSFKVTLNDTAEVRRMTSDDTLRVHWDVKGTPTLLVHEAELPDSGGKVLELTLVVQKGGKDSSRFVQVEVLPKASATTITFNTRFSQNEDTLIAEGNKNPGVWGDRFEIATVSNASNRPLIVSHANRTATFDKNGSPSDAFSGTPVEGIWRLLSLLTPAEKANHSALPERLQINTTITYKRRK